MELKERCAFYT